MDLFVVDTIGAEEAPPLALKTPKVRVNRKSKVFSGQATPQVKKGESDSEDDYGGLPPPSKSIAHIINKPVESEKKAPKPQNSIDDFCRQMGWTDPYMPAAKDKKYRKKEHLQVDNDDLCALIQSDLDKELKNAATKGLENVSSLETCVMSDRKLLKLRKKERSTTKGKDWFNLPATEMTEEVKNNLELIKMRGALDPKHFYKRSEMKTLPKYFQIGKVLPSPLDHFSERGERTSKTKTLVDELMADADFQRRNKRKYREILESKRNAGYTKAAAKMKKLKKRK